MTTNVIINAHCGTNRRVSIKLKTGETHVEQFIDDGQSAEICVYDDREVSVQEVLKT